MVSHMLHMFLILIFLVAGCSSEDLSKKNKLETLNAKIHEVSEEIKKTELEAMKGELDSQGALRDDYSKFASKLSQAEKNEVKAEELKKQLKALELEKSELTSELPKEK